MITNILLAALGFFILMTAIICLLMAIAKIKTQNLERADR
jgi:hypothetical protein